MMIDKDQVLALTDQGLNIFSHYLGFEVNLHRNFRSPFYDDKRASCHVYYDKKSHIYKYYDHGDPSYAGDCFWFVAQLRGIDLRTGFREILQIIVQELGLRILAEEQAKKPIATETLHTSTLSESVQDEPPYSFEIQPFDDGLLAYWAHYGIYEDTLRRFRVRSLKSYRSQTKEGKPFVLKASPTEPIYAYIGDGYIKIYRPNSSKMRFLYRGRIPSPYCFGMEQLPSKGDMRPLHGISEEYRALTISYAVDI